MRKKIFISLIALFAAIVFFSGCESDSTSQGNAGPQVQADDWSTGNDNAAVTMIVYSDLQCPACRNMEPILQSLLDTYPNDIRMIYRHFPLAYHPNSQKAAEATEAAGAQGKFWEMHNAIFATEATRADGLADLSDEQLLELAGRIDGLDTDKFAQELSDGIYASNVSDDYTSGQAFGVDYTPYIFINGEEYKVKSFVELRDYIGKLI